ncbi:MAG: GNAT family N-acetyltransferase [Steroidobacteraceae bacterium]
MTAVREFAEKDIPAAADLLARVSPEHGWGRREDCESYFREMLFANPWRDLDVPSWVAVQGGRLAGFYAVMPRLMSLHGRPLRAAVGCQISVAPEFRRSPAMLQLVQACLRGPQELTLADNAHERSRGLWVGLGGLAPALYGLNWIRPLRPLQCLVSLLAGRGRIGAPLAWLSRPFTALADRWLAEPEAGRADAAAARWPEQDLDAAAMLADFDSVVAGNVLRPQYGRDALEWLLRQVGRQSRLGTLRARGLRDGAGRMAGWYLYYARPTAIGEVVQVAARAEHYGRVLDRLLNDAACQGLAGLRGRLDPRRIEEYAARRCWFAREGRCTLLHSREPGVLAAFQRGEAFLSRMEGEWWTRFVSG